MTPAITPDPELVRAYEEAEQQYLRSLPVEHFIEATDHATQRKITLESFDLIHALRPDVQCFNELLVQYPRGKRKKFGQVVPDNFVVMHPEPILARGSFNLPLQPTRPFLVLEYVSKYHRRKDYEDNFEKYEDELKVPYYLLFYPDNQELTLFRITGDRYIAVPPNSAGRLPVPELELEVGLREGWARFWFRGELLPLPADLLRDREEAREQLKAAQRDRDAEHAAREMLELELARLRAELASRQQPDTSP